MTSRELTALPLFISAETAAEIAGLGVETIRDFMDRSFDPMPQLAVGAKGSKRLIPLAQLAPYLHRQCVGSAEDPSVGTMPRIN
jgi:hypothetical protein